MNREAIISQTIEDIIKQYPNSTQDQQRIFRSGFKQGAKWADENPILYNDEKYHPVKVKDLDELNRKAKAYDEMISIITGYEDDFEGYINYLRNCRDEMIN
ncbi:MAG: hypothetical protein IKU29_04930 [Parabacteroides sp.]|nr:hypothetical protein [Parabacteroides sp.]